MCALDRFWEPFLHPNRRRRIDTCDPKNSTLDQSIGADASTFATRETRSLGARLQIYRAGWSHFHTLAHAPTRRHLTEPVRGSRQLFHSGLQAAASLASLSLYVVLGNTK